MIKKIGKEAVFLLGGISILADMVEGCYKAEVTSFANENSLTDYLTNQDEITMQFGVGQVVAFQYSNFFNEDEEIVVPDGKIQFPCF